MINSQNMKIFFCASVTGSRENAHITKELIEYLEDSWHKVLNSYIKNPPPYKEDEKLTSDELYKRTVSNLKSADCIIAEISTYSMWAIFEIWYSDCLWKKVLTLRQEWSLFSSTLSWSPNLHNIEYKDINKAKKEINAFIENLRLAKENIQLEIKDSKIDSKWIFTTRKFKKWEVVIKWDTSKIVWEEEINNENRNYLDHIEWIKWKYILMHWVQWYMNHSCNPNTYAENYCDIALRDIETWEEITSNYFNDLELECICWSDNCKWKK